MDNELAAFLKDYYGANHQEAVQRPVPAVYERQRVFFRDIAIIRIRISMTQRQLAERVGTTQPTIARIEAGDGNPGIQMVLRICEQLNLAVTAQQRS